MKLKDERDFLIQLCWETLHTAGWEDNPKDQTRTMSNMEASAIEYVDERYPHMDNWPIYVEDENNPDCMVGIEQVFDIVVLYGDGKQIRYIGTIDGLVWEMPMGELCLDENKTAARLGDGWKLSFDMSHQISGYCAASGVVFPKVGPVNRSRVTGVRIKPTATEGAYSMKPLVRTLESVQVWCEWLRHTVEMYEMYRDDYERAPRYTHSCNRYFRPCALLSFCGDTVEGRKEQWAEMIESEKSPSERAIMEAY